VGVVPDGRSFADTKSNPSSSARLACITGSAPAAAEVETLRPNIISVMEPSFQIFAS
jgi:hypothetical protein